ncbi:hypothetical protein PUNSTDRAFT_33677, partial [Punctularia strigosozonata HHB-11173 SS5]|uniref:uncharacterized protein n=1 Tax=Punctularia strigosozonata (strain HHB-11173) TaxID=741275 RepID=UPI0004416DE7
ANEAIGFGITVRGKRCIVRRLIKEITRCNKCQLIGRHFAAQCQSVHDTCGTCGSIEHATKACDLANDREKHYCVNCRTKGHASWSHDCPTFKAKNREYQARNTENDYRFFVTDTPDTWERNH